MELNPALFFGIMFGVMCSWLVGMIVLIKSDKPKLEKVE